MVWSTLAYLFTKVWMLMEMRRLFDQEKDLEIRHPAPLRTEGWNPSSISMS